MNPPFAGQHYVKHVEHAMKFLRAGGILIAILPANAWYKHKKLKGRWTDLPMCSFRESGTNVNTGFITIRN
jgi:16S rRNA G1207 methylase RsmC